MRELLIKIKALFEGGAGLAKAKEDLGGIEKSARAAGGGLQTFRERLSSCIAQSGLLAGAVAAVGTHLLAIGTAAVAGVARLPALFIAGIKGVSDFAGRMSDLSMQTGQAVPDVILLSQAFRNAGLGSEMVGQSLNLLQKALTGVNEDGQPTAGVFERLGLSISGLKGMSAVEQLEAIAAAITKLPTPADQSRAAMEMFGRSGGRMLAILKDTSAIETARTQIGMLAKNLGASAEDLDKFSDAIGALDVKSQQFFAGFAKGISGDLASAAEVLNKVDLSAFGEELGRVARGAGLLAGDMERALAAAAKMAGLPDAKGVKAVAGEMAMTALRAVPGANAIPAARDLARLFGARADVEEKREARLGRPSAHRGGGSFDLAKLKRDALGAEYGPAGDPEAVATAAAAADERRKRQKAGAFSASLAEAEAAGNTKEVANLKWLQRVQSLMDSGVTEWDARRIANAEATEKKEKPEEKPELPPAESLARGAVGVSSLGRIGAAMGESMSAAPVVERLARLIDEQRKQTKAAVDTAANTKALLTKKTTWQ